MEAIEKRFGRNTETKKVQKTLLKQQFKNFTGSSSEDLDLIHDRLQKLVSQLEIHGVSISQEDVNLKFLRSLPSEWKTHTLIWRNKTNLEEHSLDDLGFLQKTGRNLGDNRVTTIGFNMSKVESYNCHRKGHFARECRSPKDTRRIVVAESQRRHVPVETSTSNALVSQCDGIRSYDWSYQAEEEPANFALMAISSSSSSDNEVSTAMPVQVMSHTTKSMAPIIEDRVSDSEDESEPNNPKSAPSFVQPSEQVKPSGHSAHHVKIPILNHTPKPTSSKTNGSRKRKNRKTCFVCRGVDHLIKDCTFHVKQKTQPTPRNYVYRGYDKQYALSTKKYPQKHRVPAAVFTKSKPVSVTAARLVSAVVLKIMAAKPTHARSLHTKNNSFIIRHQTPSKFSKTSNSSPKVTAAHAKVVSTAKGKKGK
nr:hypothetical protein [Tanacetum cinerariifolium]